MNSHDSQHDRRRGWRQLLLATAAIAVIWLFALPAISELPPIRAKIERNEAAGIDPSAKFYTEVPSMAYVLERVREARERNPNDAL